MTYISTALRQLVVERAKEQCEYCRFPQHAALLSFQMEHIIAEKHGGQTAAENLALACVYCNRAKGSDLGSIDPKTGTLTPFYHPRSQRWDEHFYFHGAIIEPLTPEGRVTVAILQFNEPERLQERDRLLKTGQYPQLDNSTC